MNTALYVEKSKIVVVNSIKGGKKNHVDNGRKEWEDWEGGGGGGGGGGEEWRAYLGSKAKGVWGWREGRKGAAEQGIQLVRRKH